MARVSVDALGELTLKQVILREQMKDFEARTIAAMKRTKEYQDRMEERLKPIEDKLDEILGQKRQLDSLLARWAREIKDVELKDDVMRYLLGDLLATEVLSPIAVEDQQSILPGAPLVTIEEDDEFKSPSPPRRTLSCPGAPKRSKVETE
jgi:hypothetical protein